MAGRRPERRGYESIIYQQHLDRVITCRWLRFGWTNATGLNVIVDAALSNVRLSPFPALRL